MKKSEKHKKASYLRRNGNGQSLWSQSLYTVKIFPYSFNYGKNSSSNCRNPFSLAGYLGISECTLVFRGHSHETINLYPLINDARTLQRAHMCTSKLVHVCGMLKETVIDKQTKLLVLRHTRRLLQVSKAKSKSITKQISIAGLTYQ